MAWWLAWPRRQRGIAAVACAVDHGGRQQHRPNRCLEIAVCYVIAKASMAARKVTSFVGALAYSNGGPTAMHAPGKMPTPDRIDNGSLW
ncbi:hypothetical protein RP20_CCG010394 [Aedes albopictus]|nr:hypothetical protein RP20_CCG010394 [Aedes albopictus]